MIQSLNILRKDIRHLWVDLSIYAAILIAFGTVIPMDWSGADTANVPLRLFIGLLRILIPILWIVLIARLIHDESLVGDQQFWITRPYTWTSLLGAKLLFIALCVVLPFVLLQWGLLLQAGLNPFHSLPGQFVALSLITVIAWLPFSAVATVTSTVQRMFMSMLAAIIIWGAIMAVLSGTAGPRTPLPFGDYVLAIVFACLMLGTLVYQYASRNTLSSRIAIAAAIPLTILIFLGLVQAQLPGLGNMILRHHYPLSTDASLKLVFDPNAKAQQDAEHGQVHIGKLVVIQLPVTIQGLASAAQVDDQTVSFAIDVGGFHYTSPWRPTEFDDQKLTLFIPQRVLDKTHSSNVQMHLSVAAQRFRPGTPQIVTAANDFTVPGGGMCHLFPDRSGNNLSCRYAFQIASRMTVQVPVHAAPCGTASPTHPGFTTIGARIPDPAADPTIERTPRLGGAVCPGAQLTFTPYHPAEFFRLELDLPSISLDQYLVH
jgi:ABC-type transport system involved in multi-copper enzyme maturation permease subunit